MGYKRIASILPPELIQQIQKYVDGEYIYSSYHNWIKQWYDMYFDYRRQYEGQAKYFW